MENGELLLRCLWYNYFTTKLEVTLADLPSYRKRIRFRQCRLPAFIFILHVV